VLQRKKEEDMIKLGMICFTLALPAMYSPATGKPGTQYSCNLTEANSPNVRGIRLGLSTQQLLALFPGKIETQNINDALESARAKHLETVSLGLDPESQSSKDRFKGIDSLGVTLYKGRVIDFSVAYYGASFTSVNDWIAKLSEAYHLPGPPDWAAGPDETPNKVLKCNGFEVEAAVEGGGASIRVRDTGYARETEERAKTEAERKRREFKP
jgi:hypothetical protein